MGGKAKEELNKNINKVLNGKNISREALARNFYAYIEERIKEWTKYVKQIKYSLWFRRDAAKSLTEEKGKLKIYKNILKKLKLDPHYIPDETDCYVDRICSEYANASGKLYLETVFIPGFEKNYKKYCDQKDDWNEKHIKTGKYHGFVNGLINFLFDELKETITDRIEISGFIVESTLASDFGISLNVCKKIRTLFEKYVYVTKKEQYEHTIKVSGLKNEEVKEKIDKLLTAFASSKEDKKNKDKKNDDKKNDDEKNDDEIIETLKKLSLEWYDKNSHNAFYSTLYRICVDTEGLEDILKELFEIKYACAQMRTKQNQKT